jgi:hypothetical protein
MKYERQRMRRNSLNAVALAVLLFWGAVWARAEAAAPPAQPVNPPGPLFNPDRFQVNPIDFAMQAFAASALPTRSHGTAAVLLAGQHDTVGAWNLEGPLTGREGRTLTGTATLILNAFNNNPLLPLYSTPAVLQAGDWINCWSLRDTNQFRPIPPDWFTVVKDGQPIVEGDLESEVYARILTLANFTSDRAMRGKSRSDVTTTHLMTEASFYRGQVIHFEGHVHLVNRYHPPPEAAMEGVNDLYEAWIFPDTMGAQAVCVVFTEWPAGLSRSHLGKGKLKDGVRVQVAGYFFKLFGYGTRDRSQPQKKAPLLIAHTITPVGKPPAPFAETTAWVKPIIYIIPSMLVGLIFLAVGLTYYFRRQDQLLRDRLRLARNAEFVPPAPDVVPVAAPVAAVPLAQPATRGYTLRPPAPGRHGRQGDGSSSDEGSSESGGKPPDDQTGA